MVNFKYYAPTKIISGPDKESEISNEIKALNKKNILIVYGRSSIENSGLLDRVCNNLASNNIDYTLFKGIQPNPMIGKVKEGVSLVKAKKVDLVLAIGGGSVTDSAKAIAVGAVGGDLVENFIGRKNISDALPIGVILTIAAAGSEMSKSLVLTKYQSAYGVADIIMHTVERYFTKATSLDLTDDIAAFLINNVIKHGPIILSDPSNYQSQA